MYIVTTVIHEPVDLLEFQTSNKTFLYNDLAA